MTDDQRIDDALRQLGRAGEPTDRHLDAQRGRLDAALRAPARTRTTRRRWLPASGIAVAGLAVLVMLAVALQPASTPTGRDSSSVRSGLQLVTGTPGGAFAGIDLDSASAADVLEAAGASAADGVAAIDAGAWTYTRQETMMPNVRAGNDGPKLTFRSVTETWASADNRHKLSITETRPGDRDPFVGIHYENLQGEVIGDVQWTAEGARPGPRRATWTVGAGDGTTAVDMSVRLQEELPAATTGADVARTIDDVLDASGFEFRDGMACDERACHDWASYVGRREPVSDEESRETYGRGLLINALAYDVYPARATRAIYQYLAALDGTTVGEADQDGNVEVFFAYVGAPDGTGERVLLDAETGRIVERGRPQSGTARWTAAGVSNAAGEGGELCERYPDECGELQDLARRLETDPKARFKGVVDWMFIQQLCDGMIDRDGSPKEGDHMPRSMSKDPKVKAEREACEQREAAKAQAD